MCLHCCCILCGIFAARRSYASTVLVIVILPVCLSVCPSVTRVLCNAIKENTYDIFILHEKEITVVSWYQQRLVGDVLFHLKFAFNMTHLY